MRFRIHIYENVSVKNDFNATVFFSYRILIDNFISKYEYPVDITLEFISTVIEFKCSYISFSSPFKMDEKCKPFIPMRFPIDELANRARRAYMAEYSDADSSCNDKRILFPEAFDFNTIRSIPHAERLNVLAIRTLAMNYDGKPLSNDLNGYDHILFGEFLDVELDIEKVISLDNDVYWKRVAKKFCRRRIDLIAAECGRKGFSWKNLGLEMKFARMLENMDFGSWNTEAMIQLAEKLSSYVRKLDIRTLKSLKEHSLEKNPYNGNYRIPEYSDASLQHGNLSFLCELKHLSALCIDFSTENLLYGYNRRYFELSTYDFTNLANGISNLSQLRILNLRGNQMNSEGMKILMKSLLGSLVESLDLSFCQLNASSIQPLAIFLADNANHSLKNLELMGNKIGGASVTEFASGLAHFKGSLEHMGLSQNPLKADGLLAIVTALCFAKNLEKIDISGCLIESDGMHCIVELIENHSQLRKINVSSIQIATDCAIKIIRCLKINYKIEYFECRNCGLCLQHEKQIRVLLERNIYYKNYPYLLKENFTEEDEKAIDEIVAKHRHSLLNNINPEERFRCDRIDVGKYYQNLYDENMFVKNLKI